MMLDEKLLHSRLVEPGLIARLVRVESAGSTNAELDEAAKAEDFAQKWPHLSVLTAEEQTSGRGRMSRTWQSPKGSTLSTSILLRPTLPKDQWHWLNLAAGLALVTALQGHGVPAALKWPNDVEVAGRKIAGMLAVVPSADPSAVILGCGINVLQTGDQLPTPTSTSLWLEQRRVGGDPPAPETEEAAGLRTQLLADWLEAFVQLMRQAQGEAGVGEAGGGEAGMAGLRSRIAAAISTIGEAVRVELPNGTAVRGRALGTDRHGALEVEVTARRRTVLDAEAGGGPEELWEAHTPAREAYSAGDVVHLRPTQG